MNFCKNCGKKLNPNCKFCTNCGIELTIDSIQNKTNDTNSTSSSINSLNKNISTKSKTKKTKIITISIIFISLSIISLLFLFKNSILYKVYSAKAANETNVIQKVTYYDKILAFKKDDVILYTLYTNLKDDLSFKNAIINMKNLSVEEKNNLISKIYIYKASESFESSLYNSSLHYLELAHDYGYNMHDFPKYQDLINKLYKSKSSDQPSTYYNEDYSKDNTTYLLPNSDSMYLSIDDLNGYNKETLALMRNEIYARHGYIFKTEPFKTYFNSKSWYIPSSSFKADSFSGLNSYEIANVKLILNLEKNM